MQCSKEGFSGLEFAGGIPRTVGGAAFMNAGANGQESADTIENVSIIMMDGSHRVLNISELARIGKYGSNRCSHIQVNTFSFSNGMAKLILGKVMSTQFHSHHFILCMLNS